MKTLIVYYSYEGNCEALASSMASATGADLLKLEVENEKPTKSAFRFVWGGMQVYMTKKPALKAYHVDLSQYDSIVIATPCWFGTYAPAINTFLSENPFSGKKVCLLVCNGGNLRNTWANFEKALAGNTIVSKLDLVYPIKNGIEDAKKKANEWVLKSLN